MSTTDFRSINGGSPKLVLDLTDVIALQEDDGGAAGDFQFGYLSALRDLIQANLGAISVSSLRFTTTGFPATIPVDSVWGQIEWYSNDASGQGAGLVSSIKAIQDVGSGHAKGAIILSTADRASDSDPVEALRLGSDQRATFSNDVVMASGKGIDFSAAGGQILTEYSYGDWTPVISDATSGGNTATGSIVKGRYVRVGRLVTCTMVFQDVDTTGMTAGNDVVVQNLPFDAVNVTGASFYFLGTCATNHVNYSFNTNMHAALIDNQSYVKFGENQDNNTVDNIIVSELNSLSADLFFTITYETDE